MKNILVMIMLGVAVIATAGDVETRLELLELKFEKMERQLLELKKGGIGAVPEPPKPTVVNRKILSFAEREEQRIQVADERKAKAIASFEKDDAKLKKMKDDLRVGRFGMKNGSSWKKKNREIKLFERTLLVKKLSAGVYGRGNDVEYREARRKLSQLSKEMAQKKKRRR